MKVFVAFIVALALTCFANAGQMSAVYTDVAGTMSVRVTITDPLGDVGAEHFAAVTLHARDHVTRRAEALTLTAESASALLSRGSGHIRRIADQGSGGSAIDWTGVRADVAVEQLSVCSTGIDTTFTGTVVGGGSFSTFLPAMAHVSILTTLKGDADLYVFDDVGNEVCSSLLTKTDKVPDTCNYLAFQCDATLVSEVQVLGVKKRNAYQLTIYYVNAI